jgi:hypothetical protein
VNIEHSKTLCVILHHGSEEYTNKCINSLLNQKHLDIVILDNDPSQSYEPLAYVRKSLKISYKKLTAPDWETFRTATHLRSLVVFTVKLQCFF